MEKIRKFVSYYRYVWKLFLLDMFCASCIAVMDLAFPIATRVFLKDLIPNRNYRLMLILSGVLVVMYVLRMIFQYIVNYWGHVVGVRMEYQMRKELFSHLQLMDFKFFDDNKVGSLMSRIVNDLREVTELAHHGPEDLFLATLMLVGSFIYLYRINALLTIIVFVFVPPIAWFAITQRTKMRQAFAKERIEVAEVNANLENSLAGVREVKSFVNEEYEMERFEHSNWRFKEAREVAFKRMANYSSGLDFLTNLLNVAVLVGGGIFVYQGKIDYADLTTYLLFISFFLQPIRRLTAFTQQLQSGMSGFERFLELMSYQPQITDPPDAKPLEEVRGEIEFRKVSFQYNDEADVLHDVNLTIKPGETVAVVGPSGGGKTTLARLIPRFYDVTAGEVLLDGVNVKELKLSDLRSKIGIVQQDVFLFAGTIRDNILYGRPEASEEEMKEAARRAHLDDFIATLSQGYDTYIGERGIKLSGGQKQRIAIARVFLKDPPILILDEATSSLDNITEKQIHASLLELAKGRTTLLIAHRLSTIAGADRIVVIEDGRIIEEGPHQQLMDAGGIYAKLYSSQFQAAL
ncbi:MAG: ABC transporter ATP-binding protein [Firmicutes bacterium]|jgi:ATP-binding cassette subfamily B protein|nr:ABC transporter ATP-binding protein [Bacillota bacterium]HQD38935.1 ABC transporter ATP-binding protein [Bacillota bacterium]